MIAPVWIEINNWRKYNNPRKDVKSTSWYRMQNDFIEHPVFFELENAQRLLWPYILGQASRKMVGIIQLSLGHAKAMVKATSTQEIQDTLAYFEANELIKVLDPATAAKRLADLATPAPEDDEPEAAPGGDAPAPNPASAGDVPEPEPAPIRIVSVDDASPERDAPDPDTSQVRDAHVTDPLRVRDESGDFGRRNGTERNEDITELKTHTPIARVRDCRNEDPPPDPDDWDHKAARATQKAILAANPDARKARKADLAAWAAEFRRLREEFGADTELIQDMLGFVFHSAFWRSRVTEPAKIRANWDAISAQMNNPLPSEQRNFM